jgi:hypothetical protein
MPDPAPLGTESLIGSGIAWAKLVLLKVGIDATVDDANAWLPPMVSESGADDVSQLDLDAARTALLGEATGKRYPSKREILASQVEILFLTPDGQEAIRNALRERKVAPEIVRQALGE